TDYSLLYVARYRDELRHTEERGRATLRALRGTLEPVLASGGTVIAGLLCLLLSDLKSNSTLGPVAAIGIVFAMTAALTFLPAVLYAAGRVAFWPRRPHYAPDAPDAGADPSAHGVWGRIALAVRRRPRPLWILTAAALAIGCLGVTQLEADGVPQSDLVLTASSARDGQAALGGHFPARPGSPMQIIIAQSSLQEVTDRLLAQDGVESVAVTPEASPRRHRTRDRGRHPGAGPARRPRPGADRGRRRRAG